MKKSAFVFVAVALLFAGALTLAVVQPAASEKAPAATGQPAATVQPAATGQPAGPLLVTQWDKISYSLGLTGTRSFKDHGIDIVPAPFLRGIQDGLNNAKPLMTEQEMKDALTQLQKIMADRDLKSSAGQSQALQRGQAFLAENAKKDGVITLPSGLQYKVIAPGDGPSPTASDRVTVNYRGTLIDGTEFDSSAASGGPANFGVGEVIDGWQEALKLMKKGAKWQIFVPANLAYKEAGFPPRIGPNEALVFDIELLGIQKASQP